MVVVALCSGTVLLPVVLLDKLDAIIKKDYLQILQRRLKSAARWLKLGDNSVFQQENNPKHTSQLVLEWI